MCSSCGFFSPAKTVSAVKPVVAQKKTPETSSSSDDEAEPEKPTAAKQTPGTWCKNWVFQMFSFRFFSSFFIISEIIIAGEVRHISRCEISGSFCNEANACKETGKFFRGQRFGRGEIQGRRFVGPLPICARKIPFLQRNDFSRFSVSFLLSLSSLQTFFFIFWFFLWSVCFFQPKLQFPLSRLWHRKRRWKRPATAIRRMKRCPNRRRNRIPVL